MSDNKIIEDLSTPLFSGDDLSAHAALQYWTSIMGVFSSLDSNVQDNVNKLAILNSLSSMVNNRIVTLNNPAQVSMAAVNVNTVPAPNATTPVMSAIPEPSVELPPLSTAEPECVSIEDEEEIESDERKGEEVPSSEVTVPVVMALGDPDQKAEDEADQDKKKVVDLTIEDKIDNGNRIVSFKEWSGIQPGDFVKHAKTLTNEQLIRISMMNKVCLRGDALIQNTIAKNEADFRLLNNKVKKEINESTKRALELAGIITKR